MEAIMKKLLGDNYTPDNNSDSIQAVPSCDHCGWITKELDNGLCHNCQYNFKRGYEVNVLTGRCANGLELDKGTKYHAREINSDGTSWKAMCGVQPGRRSAGWSTWQFSSDQEVTCLRCLTKLKQHEAEK